MRFIFPNLLYELSSRSNFASVMNPFVHGVDSKRGQADQHGVEVRFCDDGVAPLHLKLNGDFDFGQGEFARTTTRQNQPEGLLLVNFLFGEPVYAHCATGCAVKTE